MELARLCSGNPDKLLWLCDELGASQHPNRAVSIRIELGPRSVASPTHMKPRRGRGASKRIKRNWGVPPFAGEFPSEALETAGDPYENRTRVFVGRALISDPSCVEKIRTGDVGSLKGFDRSVPAELV